MAIETVPTTPQEALKSTHAAVVSHLEAALSLMQGARLSIPGQIMQRPEAEAHVVSALTKLQEQPLGSTL